MVSDSNFHKVYFSFSFILREFVIFNFRPTGYCVLRHPINMIPFIYIGSHVKRLSISYNKSNYQLNAVLLHLHLTD